MEPLSERALARVITEAAKAAVAGLRADVDTALSSVRASHGTLAAEVDAKLDAVFADVKARFAAELHALRSDVERSAMEQSERLRSSEALREAALREKMAEVAMGISAQIKDALAALPPPPPGPRGDAGEAGRDGRVTQAMEFEDAREYFPQEMVYHRGGLWQAHTRTRKAPHSANSGWQCVARGIESVGISRDEGSARHAHFAVAYSDGSTAEFEMRMPFWVHRGVWQEGFAYDADDVVVLRGSSWLSLADENQDEPGSAPTWRMLVQSGKRGKQGEIGPIGPQGERGEAGVQGEVGPVGPQGERGETGPQGERGEIGPQGERGEAGPQGERGAEGVSILAIEATPHDTHTEVKIHTSDEAEYAFEVKAGPRGPRGQAGLNGAPGPQGERGAPGPGRANTEWRGNYVAGKTYERGDMVRYGRGLWIAEVVTNAAPSHAASGGTGEWSMLFSFDDFAAPEGDRAARDHS